MKVLKASFEIIVIYLLQILLLFISSFIYRYLFDGVNLDSFIACEFYYIMMLFNIIVIIYLLKKHYKKEKEIRLNNVISSTFMVVSISLILNMFFYYFNLQSNIIPTISIYLMILSSGIIGPIVEELLFRKILLNRLLNIYSVKKAIIIETLIFALFHGGVNGFIYAFVIGMLLSIIYVKYKNIKIPIICHMISNSLVLYLQGFNIYILCLAIVMLIIGGLLVRKNVK